MIRMTWAITAGILLALPHAALAQDAAPSGSWKVSLLVQGQRPTLWLIHFQSKDDKWTGEVVANEERAPKTTMSDLRVTKDRLHFTLKGQGQRFTFEGKLPPDGKKILGSILLGTQMFPAELESTALKSLDSIEVNKEIVATHAAGPEVIEAASSLLSTAEDQKATPMEVQAWAEKAFKSAEPFGDRYQREIALRIAGLLTPQESSGAIAVDYARRAEKLLTPQDRPNVQKRVLETLSSALTKAGKADEAKEVEARSEKIDWVKAEPFPGRKDKSERVVLVELFTGAECPPCVAADLAFDALSKTYKPTEAVLLQYHLHIPGPDPLTSPGSLARASYYGVESTPTILFNGKPEVSGGGRAYQAQDMYEEYTSAINPLVNKPEPVKVTATAVQKGPKIEITAEASDVDKPGEKIRLRVLLVEEQVDYTGGNKLPHHHHVVRALPGGAEGLALKDKTGKQSATIDLEELRKELKKALDDASAETPFPSKNRPMDLKQLSVIAFVQNDATKEILQAVQVDVKPEASGE